MDPSKYGPAPRVCLLVAAVSVAIATPSMAQAVGDWRAVPAVTSLPSRTGFALAELPSGDLLLFGGDEANPAATEWRWDGVDWHPYTAVGVPRRDNTTMAKYGTHGLIVFGGTDGGSFLTDTWRTQTGSIWYQVATTGEQPGVLSNTSLAHDPATDRMVLIGQNPQGLFTTWFYDRLTSSWSAGPSIITPDARVVTDSVRGDVLLLQGGFASLSVMRLVDETWQPLGASQQSLVLGEAAFDERRARVVVMQPYDSRATAEWNGVAFGASSAPAGQFVSPVAMAMSYHPKRQETVFVVDYGSGLETYRHAADAAPNSVSFGAACASSASLQLAVGSSPEIGTFHRLDASQTGLGAMLSAIGFSHTASGGVALPIVIPLGSANCQLLVDPAIVTFLGATQQASQLISVPNAPALLATRYDAQVLVIDASGIAGTSRGLNLQIGQPLNERELIETFLSDANRDAASSGDRWDSGSVMPGRLGGDGRHGSFSLALGNEVEPSVFVIHTDSALIPARNTLTGVDEVVTDGRFYFTDFVVPAGATVRFQGTVAAQIYVRGQVSVLGSVSVDAPPMPSDVATFGLAIGQQVSTFVALNSSLGQAAGLGGPGGARGGNGGNRCENAGPILVGGVDTTSGQPGGNVQVSVGHAYAGAAMGTGGQGSQLFPATGVWGTPVPTVGGPVYCAYFSPGGAGGGYQAAGGVAANPQYSGTGVGAISAGTIAAAGSAFGPLQYPGSPPLGYSSLQHFTIGGSGGGGGGSHGYGVIALGTVLNKWMPGHAGSGGGGVLVIRSGANLEVSGELTSRGGDCALITGNAAGSGSFIGISSPGGGGSGGSVLLQSATRTSVSGVINARGGHGGRVDLANSPLLRANAQAGDGANGNFRIEAPQVNVSGTTTPTYDSGLNRGVLNDLDEYTGSRSKWLLPPSIGLPVYLRYELLVDVGGLPVLYSDDPAISPLAANDPAGAVLLRFQGAQVDPFTGTPIAGSEGPWRSQLSGGVGSLNADRAQAVRFDMVMNKSAGATQVLELRIIWR